MKVSAVVAVLGYVFKVALKPLLIVIGKTILKAGVFALILFGFAAVGLLPPSPFRAVNNILMGETAHASQMLKYLPVFIPIYEMLLILNLWVVAIVAWYFVKWALRWAKIIA